jgi:hypothetical protein
MEKGDGYHGTKTATAQTGLMDRRWPMELRLPEPEVKLSGKYWMRTFRAY